MTDVSDPLDAQKDEEFQKFADDFKSESDRAAVILGAAKLDMLLLQILQAYFLPCATGRDELLEGDSPLGTFSARISIAYRLGLISADLARALHLIRRIRNSFAHEFSGVTLAGGAHRDRVRELVTTLLQFNEFHWLMTTYFGSDHTASIQFRAAVATVCLRLEGRFYETRQVSDSDAYTLVPPAWEDDKHGNKESEPKTPEQPTERTKATAPPATSATSSAIKPTSQSGR